MNTTANTPVVASRQITPADLAGPRLELLNEFLVIARTKPADVAEEIVKLVRRYEPQHIQDDGRLGTARLDLAIGLYRLLPVDDTLEQRAATLLYLGFTVKRAEQPLLDDVERDQVEKQRLKNIRKSVGRAIVSVDIRTGARKVYENVRAVEAEGLANSNVVMCAKGRKASVYGRRWFYLDEEHKVPPVRSTGVYAPNTRNPPYGWRRADDGIFLEKDPDEQRVIEEARRLRAAGLSLEGVCRELSAKGMKNRRGGTFVWKTLQTMLTDHPIATLAPMPVLAVPAAA